jgi:hypothetical protein
VRWQPDWESVLGNNIYPTFRNLVVQNWQVRHSSVLEKWNVRVLLLLIADNVQ